MKYTIEFIANGELQTAGELLPEDIQAATKFINELLNKES